MSIIITTYVKLFKMDCQKHDISCNIGPGGVKHAQGIGKTLNVARRRQLSF